MLEIHTVLSSKITALLDAVYCTALVTFIELLNPFNSCVLYSKLPYLRSRLAVVIPVSDLILPAGDISVSELILPAGGLSLFPDVLSRHVYVEWVCMPTAQKAWLIYQCLFYELSQAIHLTTTRQTPFMKTQSTDMSCSIKPSLPTRAFHMRLTIWVILVNPHIRSRVPSTQPSCDITFLATLLARQPPQPQLELHVAALENISYETNVDSFLPSDHIRIMNSP